MAGIAALLYGVTVYLLFLATLVYAVAFVGNLPIAPNTIDRGPSAPVVDALIVDGALLAMFAVQHSVMARQGFKRWWTRLVPSPVERTTYVLLSSLALALLLWQWRPLPQIVWATSGLLAIALQAVFWLGWAVALVSTFLISHFELFGLHQVMARLTGRALPAPSFRTPLLYRYTRHPLYLGFLLAFWAAPAMSAGHLLFAAACTGYIFIGARLEERDLVALFGEQYRRYRQRVAMIIPLPRR